MSWSRRVSRAAMVRQGWDVVAAGSAGFVEPFAPQFAQAVGRLAEAVADVIVPGAGVPVGGELGGGEPVGRRRQRPGGAHRVAHPGFVEVDTPMRVAPSRTPVGSPSRMASRMNPVSTQSRAVANRSTMPASRINDLGEFVDHFAAAQLGGIVRDRVEPQHAFTFGVGLAGQAPEVQL
jgi:hypothetical protein